MDIFFNCQLPSDTSINKNFCLPIFLIISSRIREEDNAAACSANAVLRLHQEVIRSGKIRGE